MIFSKIQINSKGSEFYKLKRCYDSIFETIIKTRGIITHDNLKFNNHLGDITKGINWTWSCNADTFLLFENCIRDIKSQINSIFKNEFYLFGASFITLYDSEISDSDFHLDVTSQYDQSPTNILTLIFPLYVDDSMGGLEYEDSDKIKIYKYNYDEVFVWDACKLKHRTQPYKLSQKKKRVLVSMNLVSKKSWAVNSLKTTLRYQGNL